jgi:Lon protease-like protein
LPEPHERTNITYLVTPDRLRAFQCPFQDCAKHHASADCTVDVVLGDIVDAIKTELEKECSSELTTHVVVKDKWVEAGIPSLREPQTTSRLLDGGAFLAIYALARGGELVYDAEVTLASPLTEQHAESDAELLGRVKDAARASADCPLCYAVFIDPVTTPCGHTLCRSCLRRVLDYARECPFCRRALSIRPDMYLGESPSYPANQLLSKILDCFWPDLVEERRQAAGREALSHRNPNCDRAIFVCTLSFPAMPTFLHVFEPRYRLMIRRALEGDRTFGMVMYHPGTRGNPVELGTLLRIVKFEFLPDGRSLIQTIGISRFRILEHDTLDGYMVARIQTVSDISLAEEEDLEAAETATAGNYGLARASLGETDHQEDASAASRSPITYDEIEQAPTKDLMEFARGFIQRMQAQRVTWLVAQGRIIYGECPRDAAVFPWWFAAVFPIRDTEKYEILGTTSVRERMKMCCRWIMEWENASW